MARPHKSIPADSIEKMLVGVAAGEPLSVMCRSQGVARSTIAGHIAADADLTARYEVARAAGRAARANRPRRRHAKTLAAATQLHDEGQTGDPAPCAPRPFAHALPRAKVPVGATTLVAPGTHVICFDLDAIAEAIATLIPLVADATARAEQRR